MREREEFGDESLEIGGFVRGGGIEDRRRREDGERDRKVMNEG